MPFWPLTLIKRLTKGSKLLPSEMDGDLTDIEDSVNALHNFFNVVLNNDGTLKNNSVSTAAIQDRAVTVEKRAFNSNFYAVATGTGDALVLTFVPPASAYAAGMVFYVKAIADNTGAATLALDGLAPPRSIKKSNSTGGVQPLVAGNIKSGGIYELVDDGTQLIITNPTAPAAAVTGMVPVPTLNIYPLGGAITWTDADLSLTIPAGAKSVVLNFRGYWDSGTDGAVTAQVRSGVLGDIYDLGECGGVDGTTNRCQIVTPCSTSRHIEYQIQSTVLGAGQVKIDLVGYYL